MPRAPLEAPARPASPRPSQLLWLKLAVASGVGRLARRSGRGGGTSLPGKVLTRLEPQAIALLAARLQQGTAVISATNGKTTTAALASTILQRQGTRLVHNRSGANMAGGVATALAASARRGGRVVQGDLGLFEVDEFWLGQLVPQLEARVVLLGNLYRDQLDRYGELDSIAERWAKLAAARTSATRFVICADDPLVATVGQETPDAVYYGLDDDALGHGTLEHASDSKHCLACGQTYRYEVAYLAHLGHWRCPTCAMERPTPQIVARQVELHGIDSSTFTLVTAEGTEGRVQLPLPGLYNVYNALGAAALCLTLGVDLQQVVVGLETAQPAFGRAETVTIDGRTTAILLIKNPAGANEVLRTLELEHDQLHLLGMLNDRTADGRDVSWIWDVDWELVAPKVRRVTCSGTRAADLALRLKHAGVDRERIHLVEDITAGLDAALAAAEGPLYTLPTYTAMLELRDVLSSRGHAREYWR